MADRQLQRWGEPESVTVRVDSAIVIEIGDLVWLNTDDGRPAGQDTNSDGTGDLWSTSLAVTQEAFHDSFLGVAQQRSRNGDTDDIRLATRGVHEFDCASATFEVGDLVGPAKTSGDNIENQKVVAVATENLAIGYVVKPYASATTKVMVRVFGTKAGGGIQAMA